MSPFVLSKKSACDSVIAHVQDGLATIRTGRANPGIVEHLPVRAYDSRMPLKGVASLSVPDGKTIAIEPWDKALLPEIEEAILQSNIGIHPVSDGTVIRLVMPEMTEESRRQVIRLVKERLEEGRVALRRVRERAREEIAAQEKAKEISEDERFRLQEELDAFVKECGARVDALGKHKQEEVMTV
jgi:ribosome recycling factor